MRLNQFLFKRGSADFRRPDGYGLYFGDGKDGRKLKILLDIDRGLNDRNFHHVASAA